MTDKGAPKLTDHKLGLRELVDALIADGLIEEADAANLLLPARSARGEVHPLVQIAEQKWKSAKPPHKLLSLEVLTEWLADWVKLPYYHIDPLKINVTAVTNIMSDTYAARFRILPVEVTAREVVVATAEPFLKEWEKELMPILRLDIKRVVANPLDIQRYLVEFYNLARSVKKASQSQSSAFGGGLSNFEQLVDMGRTGNLDANDQHVVHIVDWLLQYAFDQRASDIHLEPRRDFGDVRFRIDGVMHHVYQIPLAVMGAVTSRLKGLGRMDIVEKRRPLDGRIKTRSPDGNEIELRLSTMPTAFGEKMVMRIFNPDVITQSFREMGFSDEDVARWTQMTSQSNGIILVTGPTGSGKTTTLYSALRQLAVPEVNVCTIEDPIEMIAPQLNQMQVQHNIGLDFASGVRTLMRQDPDIIMVGEIRDLETAEMAIQAALTGHLVLSTLHTNDAPSAISRLLDLGVPPYLLNATLLGVMAQRLVRTLCPHCKEREALDGEVWESMVKPWKAAAPATACAPKGCLECRMTGYLGRIGLYEMLIMSPGLRKLIKPACDVAALREQAYKEGMKPLRISGAQKVASGLTTIEEVLKVAPPPYGI
ncbi:type II secretory pathway, ATPase PulE/Tfp pilus assembly pathway, ATPase PilB [Sulfuricella denitrificans skB26]|uniref:Type II secretory pathway, ATPase PulE/Tfp pilus assembly pathway, ATPase PilB n=1 Tax=Sulfuricella denitrificans (strain DSM 22764 / NBRC 105220 / skB26) TaxID=1163617 RepID=S6AHC5_SULDS|nr:GspE/PulE family protein [Sulfuricella denitrificans]BAN33879.1 type II secretory pathway, ATPase PulE/Tfp pilus assembly pathway, ATPase PilB [Sulfuricella denitrificans skB26]